ncbi:CU044_2847 family protein [Streptomyces sp. KL118A]|uniref:CU044_2847 family protein n=2 Tax=Streptomyces TaxID=1883 RepID=UPI00278BF199|nr:CU044_2847 family protein [Streptomyces sp. KL118A]
MAGHVQQIELPDGKIVHARIGASGAHGEDDEDVGVLDTAVARVEELGELIRGVGASVLDAAAAAKPDEASVTFGVELSAKPGKVIAVLAEGEAKASVQVTLTWQLERRERGADPAVPDATTPAPDATTPAPGTGPTPDATPTPRPDGQRTTPPHV